jgi:osmoprotectant transport system ATP-binding protein
VILSEPADDFVSDFIGSGASLKRLNLARVRDYELAEWPTGRLSDNRETLMASLRASDKSAMLLLDDARHPRRWVRQSDLRRSDTPLDALGLEIDADAAVRRQATLADALNELVRSRVGSAVVVDNDGVYAGTVDIQVIMAAGSHRT